MEKTIVEKTMIRKVRKNNFSPATSIGCSPPSVMGVQRIDFGLLSREDEGSTPSAPAFCAPVGE